MTTIEIDDKQARVFLLLSRVHAWDIKNGGVEIRFDENGEPYSAKVTELTFLSTRPLADNLHIVI